MSKLLGKYRAIVVDNKDPEKRGRIKVQCPKAYGDFKSPWCLPCVPYAGDGVGFIAVPPKGEVVWLEFEEGDTQYPIWVGSWWTPDKTPLTTAEYDNGVVKIKHKSGSSITLNANGSVTIKGFTGIIDSGQVGGDFEIKGNLKVVGNTTTNYVNTGGVTATNAVNSGSVSTGNVSSTGHISSNSLGTNSVSTGSVSATGKVSANAVEASSLDATGTVTANQVNTVDMKTSTIPSINLHKHSTTTEGEDTGLPK